MGKTSSLSWCDGAFYIVWPGQSPAPWVVFETQLDLELLSSMRSQEYVQGSGSSMEEPILFECCFSTDQSRKCWSGSNLACQQVELLFRCRLTRWEQAASPCQLWSPRQPAGSKIQSLRGEAGGLADPGFFTSTSQLALPRIHTWSCFHLGYSLWVAITHLQRQGWQAASYNFPLEC